MVSGQGFDVAVARSTDVDREHGDILPELEALRSQYETGS
jgi:hypothetical protein